MSAAPPAKLPRRQILAYGLPWFVVQLCILSASNFVTGYYADGLGVPLLAISMILLAGRFIDAVTDPLVGMLSDRTPARFRRRKSWIAAGVPLMMIGGWVLFVPPEGAGALYLFGAMALMFFAITMVQVPMAAWGAELSPDYDERSRIVGWREVIGVLGMLTAICSPVIAAGFGLEGLGPALFGIALVCVVALPLMVLPTLLMVPDKAGPPPGHAPSGVAEALRNVVGNKEYVWVQTALLIGFLGIAPGGPTGYLMIKYAFGAEELYGLLVLAEFVAMLVFLPFWTWLGGKIGKHRAIALGFSWMALFTAPIPLITGGDAKLLIALVGLRGIGFGAALSLTYSLFADVIDVDTARTGRRRSGLYMALAGFFIKLALTGGAALALAWPAWFGFDQNDPSTYGEARQLAVSYAWISAFFWLLSVPLFWTYPLTRSRQEALRRTIETHDRKVPAP